MSSHRRPKPNSSEGKRLERVKQRRAYFAQAGVTIESVRRFDALLEKAGVRVAPEDWEVAIDWALQTYPIDTSRPVALAAIAASYAATLNSANHAASTSSRNLATALSGDPIHAWRMVFGISDEHGTLLGEAPLDVIDETCRTVADHPAWGVLGAARSVYLVASRQVTQVVDERVLRGIVGGDDAARDVLGGKVSRFAVSLAKDLGIPWKEGGGADLPRVKADIEAQYGALVEEAKGAGAWPWDEVLAKHLERTGPTGADYAAKIRETSRKRVAEALAGDGKVGNHAGPGAMLRLWNDPWRKPLGLRWLSQVAKSLWYDEVKPERDGEGRARTTSLKLPNYLGTGYARMSVIAAPLGEFVGGEGKDEGAYITQLEPGNGFVEISEELLGRPVYASSAAVLAFKGDKRRGRQAAFSFTDERASDAHGVIDALASCQLDLTAGKLAAVALADKMSRGGGIILDSPDRWVDVLLGTRFDASGELVARTIRRSDGRKELAHGLAQLDQFMLLLPGSAYARAFVVQNFHPDRATGETRVGVGCAPSFLEVDPRVEGKAPGVQGGMLVDLVRLLAHSGNEGPRHFRVQLALSSLWNRAHTPLGSYDPSKLAFMSDLELARESNALSMQSIATLEGSASDAARLRRDRKHMRDSIDRLQAMGIVGEVQERKRRGKAECEYRVHPPRAYSEARARGVDARLAQPEKGPAK